MRTVREYVARLNAVHTGNLNKARVDIVRGTASFVSKNRIVVKRMHDANDVKWSPVTYREGSSSTTVDDWAFLSCRGAKLIFGRNLLSATRSAE